MKKMLIVREKNIMYIFLIAFLLISCNGSNANLHVIAQYYLIPIEGQNGKELAYKVNDDGDFLAIVKGTIVAIGHDSVYMIIKQIPLDNPINIYHNNEKILIKESTSFKKNIKNNAIQYFIVPVYKTFTYSPEKGILGPLNLDEFNEKVKKLRIKADFTKI